MRDRHRRHGTAVLLVSILLVSCGSGPQGDLRTAGEGGADQPLVRCASASTPTTLQGLYEEPPPPRDPSYVFEGDDAERWVYLHAIDDLGPNGETGYLTTGDQLVFHEVVATVARVTEPRVMLERTFVLPRDEVRRFDAATREDGDLLVGTWRDDEGQVFRVGTAVLLGADGTAEMVMPCGSPDEEWPAGLDAWLVETAASRGQTPAELVVALAGDPELIDEVWVTTTTSTWTVPTTTTLDPALLAGGRLVTLHLTIPKDWVVASGPTPALCPRTRAGLGLCTLLGPGNGTEFRAEVWFRPDEPIELVLTDKGWGEVVDVVATISPTWVGPGDSATVELTGDIADARVQPR